MLVPPEKGQLIASAEAEVKEIEDQYVSGLSNAKVSVTIKWWIFGVVLAI